MEPKTKEKAALALGMFDGMHLGHRALMQKTIETARKYGAKAVVHTFLNHPLSILAKAPKQLSTPEERRTMMLDMGIDEVVMLPFDLELSQKTPEEFIEILQERYDIQAVITGFNYHFGRKGSGTPELLRQLGNQRGFEVCTIPKVTYQGEDVSSSRIRLALEAGDIALATALLQRPYCLTGTVEGNKQIGRSIGFPTANLHQDTDRPLPQQGVYATAAVTDGRCFAGITNIGTNPTVNGDRVSIETHLLGFEGDLYGKALTVYFLKRIRPEHRFPSTKALAEQIAKDAATAETVFQNCYKNNDFINQIKAFTE